MTGAPKPARDDAPTIAFCIRRAGGDAIATHDADRSFYAASTVKLAVLVAAARALEAGALTEDTPVVVPAAFRSDAPGAPDFGIDPDDVDEGLPAPGSEMRFAEVVERMIVVSSNEATNMVTDLVGLDAVRAVLADAGATATSYDAKYSDFAAARLGARRETTAADLAALMSAVVTGSLAGPARTAWMTSMLGRQEDRQLTVGVPDGVPFGSKSGTVDGIRHDVAFIGAPGPDCLVLAVCTRGFEHAAAEEAIQSLGRLATSTSASSEGTTAGSPLRRGRLRGRSSAPPSAP